MQRPAQASVRALIEDEGRILLVTHLTNDGREVWTVPGGRARIGEDPREAVVREVREETCLDVAVGDPVGAYSFTWDGGDQGVVATVFECTVDGGTVDVGENPEDEAIVGFDWLTPGEVATVPMLPALETIVVENATER